MLEIRAITETWDDLVLIDGLKAARTLVDTRTELENALSITPDRLPRTHIVGPKITIMEKCIAELDNVVTKLKKQFVKLNAIIDSMEAVLIEAHKMKGWQWVQKEPLWTSWSLEKFGKFSPFQQYKSIAKQLNSELCLTNLTAVPPLVKCPHSTPRSLAISFNPF
ncbi:hypothetical protein AX16_008686 [Volvariella volvacea WC 439]|nr:hypothetical protein AX16_008686 [Volvariella volvacea WC 439]